MLKVSDAVTAIIVENPLLHFGYHHQLLNLSQVARYIRPMVEARTRKDVQETAVLMALSRLRKTMSPTSAELPSLFIDKINIHTGLCSCTWVKNAATHAAMNRLYQHIQKEQGFVTITEGMTEITVILPEDYLEVALEYLGTKPKYLYRAIAAVGVKFDEKHLTQPGLIYQLVGQITLQRLNLIEVTSTATEFNMYLAEDEVQLAFDSLYRRFLRKRRH